MPTLTLSLSTVPSLLAALPAGNHSVWSILLAILGIGFLIFIHELGHFLACRLTKTRVETFSIGFGPRLFGWETHLGKRTFTVGPRRIAAANASMDVCLAAIPLGGYVKMAGEIGGDGTATSGVGKDPTEVRAPRPDEFPAKPVLSRIFIISAGVIMNAITAFVFFWIAYAGGLLETPPVVGEVTPGGPGWAAGLQAGDRVTSLDGERIRTFTDLQSEIVYLKKGTDADLEIVRAGTPRTLHLKPEYDAEIGLQRAQIRPVATWEIRTGPGAPITVGATERVLVDGRPAVGGLAAYQRLHDALDLARDQVSLELPERAGQAPVVIDLRALRRAPATGAEWKLGVAADTLAVLAVRSGGPAEAAGVKAGDVLVAADGTSLDRRARLAYLPSVASLEVRRGGASLSLAVGAKDPAAVDAFLRDLAFVTTPPSGPILVSPAGGELADGKSPAGEAGVLPGDRLLAVAGKAVATWADVIAAGQGLKDAPVEIEVQTGGQPSRKLTVHPKPRRDPKVEEELFGLEPFIEPVPVSGVLDAAGLAFSKSVSEIRNIFRLMGRFFGQEISFQKNVAGPLTIANLSSRTAKEGWTKFLAFLAFISINLCVLNVLPIPVLDGGQLLFLLIEKVRGGRPLSEGTIAKFQLAGFGLLMLLMVFALKNDVVNLFGK